MLVAPSSPVLGRDKSLTVGKTDQIFIEKIE